jgi:hypothetical protein
MKKDNIGSSFDSFLEEEGIKEEVELRAQKAVIARRVADGLARSRMTQTQLATAMDTSRTVVHRLLDPTDTSVTLATLARASKALGVVLLRVADSDAPESSTEAVVQSRIHGSASIVSEPSRRTVRKPSSRARPTPAVDAPKAPTIGAGRAANRAQGPGLATVRARPSTARTKRKPKHISSR